MIPDGTYDAFIVDADDDTEDGLPVMRLSVTILAGDHKGDVVDLSASGFSHDSIDLIGMPATLTVTGGVPALTVDEV